MKKFRYSLQTVLNYKNQILDRMKEEYAARMAKVREQQKFIDSLKSRAEALAVEFDEVKHRGAEARQFVIYSDMIAEITRQIERETEKLHVLEKSAEEQKKKVIAADVDVRKFEKLKEHKLEEYHKAEIKDNEAFIEEFVSHETAVKSEGA